jgi:two-component system, chemotaxis family, sensor kinase CheA
MNFELYDHILDSIWVFNKELEIIYFNSASAALLDVSPKRIKKGKKVHSYLNFEDSEVFFMSDGHKGKDVEMKLTEIPFKTFKGKEGIALVTIKKLNNEELWLCQIRDITLEVNLHSKYHEKLREMEAANKKLEAYNKNLEKMVAERTEDLKKANKFLAAMMNGLGQGLVVFDENLHCSNHYTKICDELFFQSPSNSTIDEVLSVKNKDSFSKWTDVLFKNLIPFKDAARLGPKFIEKDGRYVVLEYHPLEEDKKIKGVMVVATDKTEEKLAKEELEVKRSFVEMVTSILHRRKQFSIFKSEFKLGMSYIHELVRTKCHDFDEAKLKITLHSLKGSALSFSMKDLGDKLHQIEDYLSNTSIRESSEMIILFGELGEVYENSFRLACELLGESNDGCQQEMRVIKLDELESFWQFLLSCQADKLAENFYHQFIKEPLSSYFDGVNEIVENIALELNKKVAPVKVVGGDLRLDTRKLDEFFNALPHLFRNCVYHGIEKPDERLSKSKGEEGHIEIEINYDAESQELYLSVKDDGAGVNLDRLREKLVFLGVAGADKLSKKELAMKIFEPDISTSESVNKISGRGVGMHALKVAVDNLDGILDIKTEKNKGTEFIFRIPLAA